MLKLEYLLERMKEGRDDKDYAEVIEIIENTRLLNKGQKITVTSILQSVENLREKLLVRAHGNSLLKGLDYPKASEVY